jgi:hypothetical protein
MTEQTSLNLSSIEITAGRATSVLLQIRSPKTTALPDFVKRDIFTRLNPERQTRRLIEQLEALGHHVTLETQPMAA